MTSIRQIKATGPSGIPTVIHNGLEVGPATADLITTCTNTLAVAGFRGAMKFEVFDEGGILQWTSLVNFTDDIPNGTWSNVLNNAKSFS